MFKIQKYNQIQQVEILLTNNTVIVEPDICAFIQGYIKITKQRSTFKELVKSHFVGKRHDKLLYTGTGQIYLKPSFKNFHLVVLNNDHLILETGVFCAAYGQLTVTPRFNLSLKSQLYGLPTIQTIVKGSGHLIISSPGPIQVLELNNDKFIATNGILARSNSLSYTKESLINNVKLQENTKLAHVFRGTGKIFFAPYYNQNILLTSFFY